MCNRCYFSNISYKKWRCFTKNTELNNEQIYSIKLVSGIANPNPLIVKLQQNGHKIALMQFADHHNYTKSDINAILKQYNQDNSAKKLILTTEKDATKLRRLLNQNNIIYFYYIPIDISIDKNNIFNKQILDYVRKN